MKQHTLQERIEIIKIHYKNGENFAETVRKTLTFSGRREAPCQTAIKKLVEKVELLGQVSDLGLKAHKVQLTQELRPADHQERRVFDPEFHRKIILSDEAHFHLWLSQQAKLSHLGLGKPKNYC